MTQSQAFYQLTTNEWCEAWESLKPAEIKVLYYLRTLHPFGGELRLKTGEVAEILGLNRSTVSRALGRLAREGWIQFEEVSLKLVNTLPQNSEPEVVRSPEPECDRQESNAIVSSSGVTGRSQSVTARSHRAIATHKPKPETLAAKESQNALDLKDPKEEKTTPEVEKFSIPRDLRSKLEELEILTGSPGKDSAVLQAIAKFDVSQTRGAANHVEKSFESCSDPRAVFLYQLRRQPVEKTGLIQPLKTAADFQMPIAALKQMYPGSRWQEAARAFGYSEEAITSCQ